MTDVERFRDYYDASYPPDVLNPPAPAATGATAGTPGTWTPAGSTPPASLAALQGADPAIAANPATAWTAGQYVQTATAGAPGQATWTGSGWVGGVAPATQTEPDDDEELSQSPVRKSGKSDR